MTNNSIEIVHDDDDGGAHGTTTNTSSSNIEIKFSHVQLYVDHVCPVDEYKELEAALHQKLLCAEESISSSVVPNDDDGGGGGNGDDVEVKTTTAFPFPSHGRDVVKVRDSTIISTIITSTT
jgi:hypothetical protein